MRACLWSRTAMRVLAPLAAFPAPTPRRSTTASAPSTGPSGSRVKTTLAVDATGTAPGLHHTGFVALKVKDAVVDALRDALGGRPDVDTRDPDVRIVVHLVARPGRALARPLRRAPPPARLPDHHPGRPAQGDAGRVAARARARRRTDRPFLDPLCGSGTLAIEHALAARRIAPGLTAPSASSAGPATAGESQSAWDRMKEEARAAALPAGAGAHPGRATGIEEALDAARRNAGRRASRRTSSIELADARTLEPCGERGTLCTNPPYGERLGGQRLQLAGVLPGLGEAFRRFHGWHVVILSGNPLLERNLGMKPEFSHRLWNGPLEVNLLRYLVP